MKQLIFFLWGAALTAGWFLGARWYSNGVDPYGSLLIVSGVASAFSAWLLAIHIDKHWEN